jgi:hypothetical protein
LTLAKSNQEHREEVKDLRNVVTDTIRRTDLDKRRRDNGSGEFGEFRAKQQGLNNDNLHREKINHLSNLLINSERRHQGKLEFERDLMNDALREQKVDAVASEERKINEANAKQLVIFAKERERGDKQIENHKDQNRVEKEAFESQLMHERHRANDRIVKLNEAFNKSMITLEEKHNAALTDVTSVSNKDKTQFYKQLEERRREEHFDMKRAFAKMMDDTIQEYENRLASYQRDNENLKMTMDQKVTNILDQTQKQIESQTKLFANRKSADLKDQQLLMDQRESQLKRNLSEMNSSYQKKIDKLMIENDTKFKLMTNEYENKLKENKAFTSKALADKDADHQIELDRVQQTYEATKAQIIDTYERQIEGMKEGHKGQLRHVANHRLLE